MDKKLKNAADKIKMPEDIKERIIRACESAEENNITRIDSADGYTEVASGTDRVTSRSRIIRTVGAAAACMVLLAGIGTTGVLLHRQNSNIAGSDVISEGEHSSPFGDFSTFKYSFDAGDGKYGNYSAETYAKLNDFLNKFDWGESVEKEADRDKEADVEEPMYNIKWTRGDTPPIDCNIHIASDGYVFYQESMMDFETGGQMPLTENSKWYKIDFDAFESGIKDILAQDTDKTPFGDFGTFDFVLTKGNDEKVSDEFYDSIADYLNDFDWGDEVADNELRTPQEVSEEIAYNLHWEIGGKDCHLYIEKDGHVHYNANVTDDESHEVTVIDERNFNIDFDAFDSGINEIIAQENDITQSETDMEKTHIVKLGESCETENWEYLIKKVKLTKRGDGMDILPEGHYSCDKNGDLTCDSTYIIADMEVTNTADEDRSLYMNSSRVDLYNYDGDKLDPAASTEATAYTFNGDRSIYEGDYFMVDFKAGETRTFRIGYIIDDEYIKKSFDVIRIEINHSGMAGFNENIRYYWLGEKTSLNDISAAYWDECLRVSVEVHEKLANCRNSMESISVWLKADITEFSVSTFNGANRRLLTSKEKDKLLSYIESHDFGENDTETVIPDVPDDFREIADDGPFKFALNIYCDNVEFIDAKLAFTRDMKYAAFYYGGVLKYLSAIEIPDAEQLEFLYNTD